MPKASRTETVLSGSAAGVASESIRDLVRRGAHPMGRIPRGTIVRPVIRGGAACGPA